MADGRPATGSSFAPAWVAVGSGPAPNCSRRVTVGALLPETGVLARVLVRPLHAGRARGSRRRRGRRPASTGRSSCSESRSGSRCSTSPSWITSIAWSMPASTIGHVFGVPSYSVPGTCIVTPSGNTSSCEQNAGVSSCCPTHSPPSTSLTRLPSSSGRRVDSTPNAPTEMITSAPSGGVDADRAVVERLGRGEARRCRTRRTPSGSVSEHGATVVRSSNTDSAVSSSARAGNVVAGDRSAADLRGARGQDRDRDDRDDPRKNRQPELTP